ncbi:MAG: 2'-deoxycytidine 5'-triphosphate deaminase, partial [Dehalococcoidia bacterium]|nr:2'-deoxycytidine 5'-triphosphate deaminase [Dehalococcoidia bacterium]
MSEVADVSHEVEPIEGEQAAAPWCPPPAAEPVWPETWDLPPGVLPRQRLREAEDLGIITTTAVEIPESGFQPASLDLLLGPTAYRIGSSFLPGDCTVRERLNRLKLDSVDLRSGGILEPNRPYLIPLMEGLKLPSNVRAFANPKSSTGRVDIFTRVVTDYSHRFDDIAPGYDGELWLEVFSRSFLVRVQAGLALNQIRFIVEDPTGAPAPPPA